MEDFFNREAELVAELGFGNGEFLVNLAKENPSRNYVGFETSLVSIVKIQKRIHAERLDNVRVFMVDGQFGLREFLRTNPSKRFTSTSRALGRRNVTHRKGSPMKISFEPWPPF